MLGWSDGVVIARFGDSTGQASSLLGPWGLTLLPHVDGFAVVDTDLEKLCLFRYAPLV